MFNINFEEIDIHRIGQWPLFLKAIVVVINCILFYLFFNWLFISSKLENLSNLKAEEARLRTFFVSKQRLLIDIEDYKNQMNLIENRLAKLVKKLPEANELPNLINQISQAGNDSGLFFREIKVMSEKKFKYYVELPINITVDGNYHQLGDFISKISGMSRVITFHDFKLERAKDLENAQKQQILSLNILAKTYRYLPIENKDKQDNQDNQDERMSEGAVQETQNNEDGEADAAKI